MVVPFLQQTFPNNQSTNQLPCTDRQHLPILRSALIHTFLPSFFSSFLKLSSYYVSNTTLPQSSIRQQLYRVVPQQHENKSMTQSDQMFQGKASSHPPSCTHKPLLVH